MKLLAVTIIIGPLMLIAALPAAAGQSMLAHGARAPVLLAASGDSTTDRASYAQQARDEMREWQRKLRHFGAAAAAKGNEAANAAERI